MVAGVPKNGGIGHKIEQTQGLQFTATITGGDAYERRFRNNYSKLAHADQDKKSIATTHDFPDISMPKYIGGIR